MTKYDVIYEELQSQVESGDLTVETAEYLNDVAYEMYGDDELDDEEFTEAQKNRTRQSYLNKEQQDNKAASNARKDALIEIAKKNIEGAKEIANNLSSSDISQLKGAAKDINRTINNTNKREERKERENNPQSQSKKERKLLKTIDRNKTNINRLSVRNKELSNSLNQANEEINTSKKRYDDLENSFKELQDKHNELIKYNTKIENSNNYLSKTMKSLYKSNSYKTSEVNSLRSENEKLVEKNNTLRDKKNKATKHMATAKKEITTLKSKADKNLKLGAVGGALAGTAAVGGTVLAYKGIKKHNANKVQKQMIKNKIKELEVMRDQANSAKRKLELSKQIDELKAAI